MKSDNYNVLQVAITFEDIREWCPPHWTDIQCLDFMLEYSDVIRNEMISSAKIQLKRCIFREIYLIEEE